MATKTTTHHIDAAGKSLGRVAAEAAKALMGKTGADYTPNIRSEVKVTIVNASKLYIRERKSVKTVFTRYTGYPGGFKTESLSALNKRKPNEAVRRAIEGMLPKNTFRTERLKNLTITA